VRAPKRFIIRNGCSRPGAIRSRRPENDGRPAAISVVVRHRYKSRNPNAGVYSFEFLPDAIILEFIDRQYRYLYNAARPGREHVNEMKRLALAREGLTTYVNQHVRENYAAKFPADALPPSYLSNHQPVHHRSFARSRTNRIRHLS
jgi:hypothetical protein